jgi:hypothetical protein
LRARNQQFFRYRFAGGGGSGGSNEERPNQRAIIKHKYFGFVELCRVVSAVSWVPTVRSEARTKPHTRNAISQIHPQHNNKRAAHSAPKQPRSINTFWSADITRVNVPSTRETWCWRVCPGWWSGGYGLIEDVTKDAQHAPQPRQKVPQAVFDKGKGLYVQKAQPGAFACPPPGMVLLIISVYYRFNRYQSPPF